MKVKKQIVCCLAMLISCIMIVSASASETESEGFVWADNSELQEARVAEARASAYEDISVASDEMKAEIQEARQIIINNESWVADGCLGTIVHADGTTTEVPQFSELFPGWEAPVEVVESVQTFSPRDSSSRSHSVSLATTDGTTSAVPFTAVSHSTLSSISTKVNVLYTSTTCNIGYSIMM